MRKHQLRFYNSKKGAKVPTMVAGIDVKIDDIIMVLVVDMGMLVNKRMRVDYGAP